MKYTNSELCLIWLDSFLGLEYKHKIELYRKIKGKTDIKAFIEKSADYVKSEIGKNQYDTLLSSANQEYLNYVLGGLEKRGVLPITIESDSYPEFLKQTSLPPIVLYTKGDISLLNGNNFGIVGSRKNLPLSISQASVFAKSLVGAGFNLVTGIAEGVDATVLKTVVDENGKAISVIAGGFDNVYPKSNVELLEKVIEKGLAISEYPPETSPKPFHFPVRNRIISALSKGILIVSGALKSGTMYTAEYAEEYGKDLFAIPYSPGVVSGAGCNELIKRGARLADTPKDILDFYGIESKEMEKIEFSENEKKIIEALKDGEKHVELLAAALNKRVFEIMPDISALEINGVLVKSGNVYGLTRNNLEA